MRIVIDTDGDGDEPTVTTIPGPSTRGGNVVATEGVLVGAGHDLDAGAAPTGPARSRANVTGPPSDAEPAGEAPVSIASPTFSPPSSADGTIAAALSTVDSSPSDDGDSAGEAPALSA
jgi:hypothetical protein